MRLRGLRIGNNIRILNRITTFKIKLEKIQGRKVL